MYEPEWAVYAERFLQRIAGLPDEEYQRWYRTKLAGDRLAKLLKTRIAFHHSGLSYAQCAGLIEPLAKAGQLRAVVATTGVAAGINFSMRSVLVTETEYTVSNLQRLIRPDELLQMFGRAGRRGLERQEVSQTREWVALFRDQSGQP